MQYEVRASSVPRAWRCGNSVRNPDNYPLIDPTSSDAGAGTAAHELLARHLAGEHEVSKEIPAVARKNGAEESVVSIAFYNGLRALDELITFYTDRGFEIVTKQIESKTLYESSTVKIPGHPDLWISLNHPERNLNVLVVLDWKLGNIDEKMEQLVAYAGGVIQAHHNVRKFDRIDCHLIALMERDGNVITESFDDPKKVIDMLHVELPERIKDPAYHPGYSQCQHCPLRFACEARRHWEVDRVNMTIQASKMLQDNEAPLHDSMLQLIKSGDLPDVMDMLTNMDKSTSAARDQIKAWLKERAGDEHFTSGDHKFWLQKRPGGKSVDITNPLARRDVIDLIGEESLYEIVGKVSVNKIAEQLINNRVKKEGATNKAQARRDVLETLDKWIPEPRPSIVIRKERIEKEEK